MFIGFDFPWKWWPWPYEAHRTAQDIEQLWEFVQAVFAQEAPDPSNPGIILDLEQDSFALVAVLEFFEAVFCIDDHGPELEHLKLIALHTNAILLEQNRALAVDTNQKSE